MPNLTLPNLTMQTIPADHEDQTWTDRQGRTRAWSDMNAVELRLAADDIRAGARRNVETCQSALRRAHSDAATQACEDLLALAEDQLAEAETIAEAMIALAQSRAAGG